MHHVLMCYMRIPADEVVLYESLDPQLAAVSKPSLCKFSVRRETYETTEATRLGRNASRTSPQRRHGHVSGGKGRARGKAQAQGQAPSGQGQGKGEVLSCQRACYRRKHIAHADKAPRERPTQLAETSARPLGEDAARQVTSHRLLKPKIAARTQRVPGSRGAAQGGRSVRQEQGFRLTLAVAGTVLRVMSV